MMLLASQGRRRTSCHHHTATLGGNGSGSVCVPILSHSLYKGCSWPTLSITSHQPRKLDARARPSPSVPKAGTSHSLCWGQ